MTKNTVVLFTKNNARIFVNPDMSNFTSKDSFVINPDMKPLRGVPTHFWKKDGDSITTMSYSEKSSRLFDIERNGLDNGSEMHKLSSAHVLQQATYKDVIKYIEIIKEVPVEIIKEVPIEVIKEVIVEVEKIREVLVETIKEVPTEKIVEITKEAPVVIEKIREVPVEVRVEVPIIVEKIKEIPVEVIREVEKEVEKIVHVPVEVIREVLKEVPIFVDRIKVHNTIPPYVWIIVGSQLLVIVSLIAKMLK